MLHIINYFSKNSNHNGLWSLYQLSYTVSLASRLLELLCIAQSKHEPQLVVAIVDFVLLIG